jgi:hypothetical protein
LDAYLLAAANFSLLNKYTATGGVHILEPHFNDEKINQVIGRAARYESHANLPEEDRNVQVYKYQSNFPKNWQNVSYFFLFEI